MQRHLAVADALDASEPPVASRPALRLGPVEWALLVLHSVLWGSAFFFVDVAKAGMPILSINALRLVPACLILLTVVWISRLSLRPLLRHWKTMVLLGIFNNSLPFILIIFAQHTVTGGVAAVFIATTPMFGLLFSHFVSGEDRITANKVAGIGLGVAGVAILTGASVVSGSAGLAEMALVMAAACYALAAVITRTVRELPPVVLATGQMAASLMLAAPLALAVDQPWAHPVPGLVSVGAVIGSGIFGSALAALCYFTILGRAGATNATLVTLLIPITPIVLGAMLLGQSLQANEVIGAVVIAAALVLIDGRVFGGRQARSATRPAGAP